MVFKLEKCYVMHIINKRRVSTSAYTLHGTILEVKQSWTYLGAVIDSKLTFSKHCDEVKKKAARSLAIIQRTLYAVPQPCKKMAYQTLVRPKLEYASCAWNPPPDSDNAKKLEGIQNKAARFVHRDYRWTTSVTSLKQDLGWPPLSARRQVRDSVMWYKIHYNKVFIHFPTMVIPKPRIALNDHDLAYLHLHTRVNAYKYSYFPRTIPLWNSLPATAVAAPSVEAFQGLVSAQLLGQSQP